MSHLNNPVAMSESKPTLIFVHGAFHGPECFKPLVQLLKNAGYPCVDDFAFPGTGNSSTSGLEEDAEALRSVVLKVLEEGNNCLLVVHSYGGIPAAQGLGGLGKKDRGEQPAVLKIVYLTGCILEKESQRQQYLTVLGTKAEKFLPDIKVSNHQAYPIFQGLTTFLVQSDVATFTGDPDVLYNDLPEEIKKELVSNLRTQSMKLVFHVFFPRCTCH